MLSQKADSLKTVLAKCGNDTTKVNVLLRLSREQQLTDTEKLKYANDALEMSDKMDYKKGSVASLTALGILSNNLGEYDKALKHLNKALDLSRKFPNDKIALGAIYNSIGASYYYKADFNMALSYFLKSANLYEGLNLRKKSADILFNMSNVYFQNKLYDKASGYLTKANRMYTELKDTLSVALANTLFGNIAYDQYKYDTALFYYRKAESSLEKLNDKNYLQLTLVGIGSTLFETGHYKEALIYHHKALDIATDLKDDQSLAVMLLNIGREYGFMGLYDKSLKSLHQGIGLSKKIGLRKSICDGYSYLSEVYEKKKDFKSAMQYSVLFSELKDSLFNEENSEQINELTAKYETEKKEKEIVQLNAKVLNDQKDKELLNLQVKEKNMIILSLIASVILIVVLIYLVFNRQKLKQQNAFQSELNIQQKNAANALVQAQENERNRIAKELHDSVGTFLSTLKLNLQAAESKIPTQNLPAFMKNTELIDKTSQELRKITRNLSNEVLQENTLANAINELKESINASGITHINFLATEPTEKFDSLLELNLYRIAQELLNNSIKHAKASHITLQLIDHGDSLLLMLEDNGIGFNAENPDKDKAQGMGLKNIKDRVNFLRGTFKIESVLEKGSTFIIEVPKQNVS